MYQRRFDYGISSEGCQNYFDFWPKINILELVSKELNHLAAILHVYAGGLNFMK